MFAPSPLKCTPGPLFGWYSLTRYVPYVQGSSKRNDEHEGPASKGSMISTPRARLLTPVRLGTCSMNIRARGKRLVTSRLLVSMFPVRGRGNNAMKHMITQFFGSNLPLSRNSDWVERKRPGLGGVYGRRATNGLSETIQLEPILFEQPKALRKFGTVWPTKDTYTSNECWESLHNFIKLSSPARTKPKKPCVAVAPTVFGGAAPIRSCCWHCLNLV